MAVIGRATQLLNSFKRPNDDILGSSISPINPSTKSLQGGEDRQREFGVPTNRPTKPPVSEGSDLFLRPGFDFTGISSARPAIQNIFDTIRSRIRGTGGIPAPLGGAINPSILDILRSGGLMQRDEGTLMQILRNLAPPITEPRGLLGGFINPDILDILRGGGLRRTEDESNILQILRNILPLKNPNEPLGGLLAGIPMIR